MPLLLQYMWKDAGNSVMECQLLMVVDKLFFALTVLSDTFTPMYIFWVMNLKVLDKTFFSYTSSGLLGV